MPPSKRIATVTDVAAPGTSVGESERVSRVPSRREKLASATIDAETFVSLEKLSRKAANDSLRTKGGRLAEDQFDSLAVHLLEIGKRAFDRFDAALTVSDRDALSFAYRTMRGYRQGRFTEGPYVDWLRTNVRDSRFEPEAFSAVTETGDLPERPSLDGDPIESVVEHYAAGLPERSAWTLRHVGSALATGLTLAEVCEGLLADLADDLRPQMASLPPDAAEVQLFQTWFEEAA